MIDVSEVVSDPDFATNYTVLRRTGKWVNGRFVPNDEPVELRYFGPVQPATVKEIEQLPEGDQLKGVVKFICKMPKQIFLTRDLSELGDDDLGAVSDEIVYRGYIYKVVQVMPWDANGFMRSFAALKGGVMWKSLSRPVSRR
jgi:hypothetical protein